MSYKSNRRPHCRICGRPIRKLTNRIFFGCHPSQLTSSTPSWRCLTEKPKTREEAQRLAGNQQIVSLSYGHGIYEQKDRFIQNVTTWDGESYVDEFFHSGECAQAMGYAAVKQSPTLGTDKWRAAKARAS